MANLKDYMLTAEAAQILGVSHNTLRAWASDGRIPVRRNPANGYRLFLRSDLQKFLRTAAQVHSTTPNLPRPSGQADRTPKKEQAPIVPYGKNEGSRSTEIAAG